MARNPGVPIHVSGRHWGVDEDVAELSMRPLWLRGHMCYGTGNKGVDMETVHLHSHTANVSAVSSSAQVTTPDVCHTEETMPKYVTVLYFCIL